MAEEDEALSPLARVSGGYKKEKIQRNFTDEMNILKPLC